MTFSSREIHSGSSPHHCHFWHQHSHYPPSSFLWSHPPAVVSLIFVRSFSVYPPQNLQIPDSPCHLGLCRKALSWSLLAVSSISSHLTPSSENETPTFTAIQQNAFFYLTFLTHQLQTPDSILAYLNFFPKLKGNKTELVCIKFILSKVKHFSARIDFFSSSRNRAADTWLHIFPHKSTMRRTQRQTIQCHAATSPIHLFIF